MTYAEKERIAAMLGALLDASNGLEYRLGRADEDGDATRYEELDKRFETTTAMMQGIKLVLAACGCRAKYNAETAEFEIVGGMYN